MKDKPTVDEIISKKDYCTRVYQQAFSEFEEDERFYELDFLADLKMPAEFEDCGIVLPTARDMVDANVDHIDVTNARVNVNKGGIHDYDKEKEELKRKFFLGVIYRTNVESTISPWRVAAKHYAMHGVCHLKDVWDADAWIDKPEQKEGMSDEVYADKIAQWRDETELSFPIQITAVHPHSVMPDPQHIKPEYYIEVHKKSCYGIINRYPKWSNPLNRKYDEDVDWVEYWDNDYKCFLVDNEPVLRGEVVKHKYGFIPYVTIEAGLGNLSIDGDYSQRYVGILRNMRDILVAESRAYSIADYILKKGAYPSGFIRGGDSKALQTIETGFGQYTWIPEGTDIIPNAPEVPPEALRVWLDITSDYISAHGAPPVTRGLGETGVRSGADRRLIMSEASLKFSHAIPAFKHGTARVLQNCIKLYKYVIPDNLKLWSRTPGNDFEMIIDRDKLKEPFSCDVEFAPISEEDEYRRHDDLLRLKQGANMPRQWVWSQMTNVDTIAVQKMLDEERIQDSQAVNQIKEEYISQRMQAALQQKQNATPEGFQGIMQQITAEQMMAQQQGIGMGGMGAPGAMTTQIPNQAMPGSPTQIAQQRNNQRPPMNVTQGMNGGGANYVR